MKPTKTYLPFVLMAIFIALAFVFFFQQGHGDGTPNTFFFIHKPLFVISSLIIAAVIGLVYIKIPKSK